MTEGDHAPATLRRYSEAQARLEHAGGWAWRDRAASIVRGLGFTDADLDRPLDTFSGGELTRASLARALSADPDLLLLDEPTNHLDVENLEWLERELTSLDAAVILVAHDRWFLEAVTTAVLELGGPKPFFFDGPWHAWRREKAARASAAATQLDRVSDDIERLERFVARFRFKKSKAKQAQAKLSQIGRLEKERRTAAQELEAMTKRRRTLGFEFLRAGAIGPDRARGGGPRRVRRGQAAPRRRLARARARRARRARRAERLRQDDAPRDAPRAAASRRRGGSSSGTVSCPPISRSTRPSCPTEARSSTSRPRPRGCRGRRRRTSSAASCSRAGRPTRSRSRCSRAASGAGSRSRSSSPRARTCSSSTSRRTISTSRAARRWRPRSRRFPERCSSSRTTARSSTPSPTGSSPSSTSPSARTTADGPTWCASVSRSPRRRRRRPGPSEARVAEAEARTAPCRRSSTVSRSGSPSSSRASPSSRRVSPRAGRTWTCSRRTPRPRGARRPARALGGPLRGGAGRRGPARRIRMSETVETRFRPEERAWPHTAGSRATTRRWQRTNGTSPRATTSRRTSATSIRPTSSRCCGRTSAATSGR